MMRYDLWFILDRFPDGRETSKAPGYTVTVDLCDRRQGRDMVRRRVCGTKWWVGITGVANGWFHGNRQAAEHAEQSVESAVKIISMRLKERFDSVFCIILWISELDRSLHHAVDERKPTIEDDALRVFIMFSRYEIT